MSRESSCKLSDALNEASTNPPRPYETERGPSATKRLLLLGGTQEARELAQRLTSEKLWSVISSLAGRTRAPLPLAGHVISGGFGGDDNFTAFLRSERIEMVVDATHPFATAITTRTHHLTNASGIPYLRLARPSWVASRADNWRPVPTVEEAALALPTDARILLTIGRQKLAPFLARRDLTIFARMIDQPTIDIPNNCTVLLARPPFTISEETALMIEHGVDHLVTKNAGGDALAAKLTAARARSIPVIMIERPINQPPANATTVAELMKLLTRHAD